ncbi:MAG: formate--tetrahydrofolate ligase [Myxococcales bacterium]|nr:formate--tetrahydrofolate ligase [Myxococcales bacterium]
MDTPLRPITDVAGDLGLTADDLEPYGRYKAKLDLGLVERPAVGKGRLILVSAINPTPAGEGKTTTSIGLAMGMRRLGKNAVLALREPSLGPVFGIKGGGTGGGLASLAPADDINLHFTGDIHAITTAHNLLSALIDNAVHFRDVVPDKGQLDPRQITWGRALDMNDRALRHCVVGLGGKAHGTPREERFDITAASEIMAVLALASGHVDLEERLSRIIVGQTYEGRAVTAGDLGAAAAMTAVLRDALKPNLVQTREGGPAIVHAGPFANIAHGCNSVLATKLAVRLGDYAITEGGFGFDLGGEKFLDIKCRAAGVWPRVLVLVATLRALKMHGGASVKVAAAPDQTRLEAGMAHLERHLETARSFGLSPVVVVNVFPDDPETELAFLAAAVEKLGARFARSEVFARGGEGGLELARVVCEAADATDASPPAPKYMYTLQDPPKVKIEKVARGVYGAGQVVFTSAAETQIARACDLGGAELPVCMAKTQLSLSDDPKLVGRPDGFTLTVREVRLAAGAGFLVALTGDVMTMPGLPKVPASRNIRLLPSGSIKGLMQND